MSQVVPVPGPVRGAGVLVALQGGAALAAGTVLVLRGLAGADQQVVNGFGTAGWFALIGVAVLAAGWALLRGRRWGRGIAVFANLALLPVAWTVAGAAPVCGAAIGLVALAVVVLLFTPSAVRWAARHPTRT